MHYKPYFLAHQIWDSPGDKEFVMELQLMYMSELDGMSKVGFQYKNVENIGGAW